MTRRPGTKSGREQQLVSGYRPGRLGIPDILAVSKAINPKLHSCFATTPPGHYGCVIVDHAENALVRLIYLANYGGIDELPSHGNNIQK